MHASELYTNEYWRTGRYNPEFGQYVTKQYVDGSVYIQAQKFSPLALNMGDGSMGHRFEIMDDAGGLSSRREFFDDVDAMVAPSRYETVYLGLNSEIIKTDRSQEQVIGLRETKRQTKAAIDRLRLTTAYLTMNADKTKVNVTDRKNGTKFYDYDGYAKFFKTNPGQTGRVLNVGDLANNVNMKLQTNFYLDGINHLVKVNGSNAEIIYTTDRGAVLLACLESDRQAYIGEYKFSRNVQTWQGLPVIVIPDSAVPTEWTQNGNIPVLFANQDEESGAALMIPVNGGLIDIGQKVPTNFGYNIGMNLTFAPVLVNSHCAALGFLNEHSGGSGISVEAQNTGVLVYETASGVFRIEGDNIAGGVVDEYADSFDMGVGDALEAEKGDYITINLKNFVTDNATTTIIQTNPALEIYESDAEVSNVNGKWVKTKVYNRTGASAGTDLDYTFLVKRGSSIITVTDGTKTVRFECSIGFRA